ncbi:MAG TPA: bifunctional diaminohydroxyphosphoribosylaminopyrimidine deaminase/5-amino-6-(5-phosphoribosylamino)uracil reductase RibD, partial [Cryomorphaceae bacterium]|nr:bifunctional diaminohydroxyphosphoribosylaminopyrimidine deaminase/5-amino-6-(5-phosphoribosylamino)uracil reductase RibD [Cryomorphaceae bacterium]
MERCLKLAQNGFGRVAPNPMVGCVIVKNDVIIGEGFHRAFGEAHAEVNAINSVKNSDDLKQSTLYVSLEPCSHQGKTPPCADLIIQSGIPRVVIAQSDPNPAVSGKGIEKLSEAGIAITTGVLEESAKELNRRFRTFHEKKRPYIILKWAMTADGYMDSVRKADKQGIFWISSPETKKLVHKWRSEEGAILIGKRTLEVDDPSLDTRDYFGKNPLRVVLVGEKELSRNRRLLTDGNPTLIIGKHQDGFENEAVEFELPPGEDLAEAALTSLYERNINSVIIEG